MKLQEHTLIRGTLLLTITGFITRIIGFIYKIYLADLLGAKMLGIYQLVFPVYGICFTIYGAGIQTAISQNIAAELSSKGEKAAPKRILITGILMGLSLALLLSGIVYFGAEWIAAFFLLEPSLAPYLQILSVLFPFCSVSACINGYYYGISQARVPAVTQIIEQIVRVSFVFLFCSLLPVDDITGCRIAVWGLVAGEIASNLYNVWKVTRSISRIPGSLNPRHTGVLRNLLSLAATLTATKLVISILHSTESVLIPAALKKFGCTMEEALSIYGILTGMSMSFLLFPSTITNSLAVMLLPNVASSYAAGNTKKIKQAVTLSVKYSLLIGLLCTAVFFLFGRDFGTVFFHNIDAGSYLVVLSWLCPFLYLGTTLTSIINGMGHTTVTFCYTLLSLSIKILFLIFAAPVFGIRGYLVGLLVSQLLLTLLEVIYLHRYILFDAGAWILLPGIFLLLFGWLLQNFFPLMRQSLSGILALTLCCGLLCLGYVIFLLLCGIISRRDLQSAST